jgi:hypothetical protein
LNGDSLAIIDEGLSFGGGALVNYGINSNTSAFGFLKCILKRQKKEPKEKKETISKIVTKPKKSKKDGENVSKPLSPSPESKLEVKPDDSLAAFRELINS